MADHISAKDYRVLVGLPTDATAVAIPPMPHTGKTYSARMSGPERQYAQFLDGLIVEGSIRVWIYEAIRLKLAEETYFTPDFLVVFADGHSELHEIKGTRKYGKKGFHTYLAFYREDSRVKIKIAAAQYAQVFPIVGKHWNPVRGMWEEERFI